MKKCGPSSLTPNLALGPPRRSSAIELSALSSSQTSSNNTKTGGPGNLLLGNNLAGQYANLGSGSRSAATSPVAGVASTHNLSLASFGGGSGSTSGKDSNSPRHSKRTSNEAWVCPNDRQLALRAKLQSGWSVKTAIMNQWKQPEPITAEEHEKIRQVVEKAEALEKSEEERLGRLIERLEGLRHSRLGNGEADCILCGEVFRFYHHSQKRCGECGKMTCGKCGKEYPLSSHPPQGGTATGHQNRSRKTSLTSSSALSSSMTSIFTSALMGNSVNAGGDGGETLTVWLCKICAEQREIWKKSGAWFFKGMPKYAKPTGGGTAPQRRFSHFMPIASNSINDMRSSGPGSYSGRETDNNSSEDETQTIMLRNRSSIGSAGNRSSIGSAGGLIAASQRSGAIGRVLSRAGSQASDEDDRISIPSANGQSMYEFEDQRLSRPRHLPSSLIPPSRSTSVPPGSTTDGRGESNGAATSHHYHAPLPPREDHRRSASPAGSLIGEQQPPVMHPNPQIAQQQHHHPHRGGGAGGGGGPLAHPPRSMSPRYFRPPPGVGPPHFRGPGPPWGRGPRPPGFDPRFSPRGPPRRHPMGPRGPPGYHPGHRSRMPGPPRGPPGLMRPPRGHPMGPRGGGPSPYGAHPFPHSAPHSPMTSHRSINDLPNPARPTSTSYDAHAQLYSPSPPTSLPAADLGSARRSDFIHEFQAASPEAIECEADKSPGAACQMVEVEDDEREEEVPSPPLRHYNKAKPMPEKENKFTSTLRRLSTVSKAKNNWMRLLDKKKKNKTKRKSKEKEMASNGSNQGDSGIEAVTTPSSVHDQSMRPSSTTSRESEADAVTSGYFSRQESQSRGSDETLSSPTPEGSHGLIEFSIAYDEATTNLLLNVIKAKKIKGMDANGLSDSFCRVSIIPPPGGRIPKAQETKTIAKSINPHYNANLNFVGVLTYDMILHSSIHLAILDEDLAGDHLLAETKFPLEKILPQMNKKFQVPLEKPCLKETVDGMIVSHNVGRVELSLSYYVKSGMLKVLIKQCHDLPGINEHRSVNSYVKAVLYPLSKSSKHETTVKWNTVNPEFHEQFVYLTSHSELPKQSLHLTVWDRGKGKPDEYIGGIILGMNAKGCRLQHWSDMIKCPGQAHAKTHYLSANYID